jgi:Ni,Fe-hydrogenase III component G
MAESITTKLNEKFGKKIKIFEKTGTRIYVDVADKDDALEVVKFLFVDEGMRFSIASGVDTREGIEILYHMADDKANKRISVRTLAAKPSPSMPSAANFMPAAEWIEREIHELLGVDFPGHPGLKKLLLPDDWPDGVYPLRKG